MSTKRRGFVLIAALWSTVATGALAITTSSVARTGVSTARNRANHTRAWWTAIGCANESVAHLYAVLWPDAETPAHHTTEAWNTLDLHATPSGHQPRCEVTVKPSGLTANVNALTHEKLTRLMNRAGIDEAGALADALLDWRDADDVSRGSGAEREWYAGHGRIPPRNGEIRAPMEIRAIRGYEELPQVTDLLGVENDRILWTRAPVAVLATLPGMSDEALSVLEARGRRNVAGLSYLAMFPEMSAVSRDSLARAVWQLAAMTTSMPEAWIVTVSASVGVPAIRVTLSTRVSLRDRRLAVARQELVP